MFKSGLILSAGNGATAFLNLARNILIARLVSVEDFGIASTFAIAMAMIEMASSLGIEAIIVQDKDGEKPQLQATAQAFLVVRGLIAGTVLYLLANPIAEMFDVPDIAWAYQAIAILPVIRGLMHLDMFRFQRVMRFVPAVSTEFSAQAVSTLVAGASALYLNDYRAMLCALFAQQIVLIFVSHYVAERPYRLSWDTNVARRTFNFAWPVIINGLLMFGIFQGDRVIVGNQMGIEILGWFAVAFALTLMPTVILSKVLTSLALPYLSKLRDEESRFQFFATAAIEVACAIGVVMAVSFAILGRPLMLVLYGAKYDAALSILVWLAVMQALRVAKSGPTNIAVAFAQTTNPMFANLARICFLPVAVIAAVSGAEVLHIVWISGLGELCALFVAYLLVSPRLGSSTVSCRRTYIGTLLMLGIILANEMLNPISDGPPSVQYALLLIVVTSVYFAVFLPNSVKLIKDRLKAHL